MRSACSTGWRARRVVDDITILRKKAGKGGNINVGSMTALKDLTPEEIEAENEAFFNDGTPLSLRNL
jgi:hypothetical protein